MHTVITRFEFRIRSNLEDLEDLLCSKNERFQMLALESADNYLLSQRESTTEGFANVKLICHVMLYCDLHGPFSFGCTNNDLGERRAV